MAKKPPATPDYLKNISFQGPQGQTINVQPPDLSGLPQNWSPQTTAAVQQYYAPGGGFQQTLNTEMTPTGQGGYTVKPEFAGPQTPQYPIAVGNPIVRPPDPAPTPQPAPPPPPPPPPPQAKMDWSGLASGLQGILAPYLSGQGPSGGNPMSQIMPLLMKSLGGYLGQLQPTQAGQEAAANQTSFDPASAQGQPSMNWGNLGSFLQNMGGQNAQGTQANLLNQMLGYMGTMPQTQGTGQQPDASHTMAYGQAMNMTPFGAMSRNVPRYMIG